jgi:ribosomal protein S18 acetylase RimI-like enzyme
MRRTTLAEVGYADLAAGFSRVYQGYAVPVAVDAAWAERHALGNDLDLASSPLWLDDVGETIGLAALGVRGERGWIGGFGLAPDARGKGLGRDLLAAVLNAARQRGLRRVQLEVLAGNAPAIALYERGGFRRTRVLRILEGEPLPVAAGGLPVGDAPLRVVIDHFDRLHAVPMAWQREAASFARLPGLRAVAAGPDAAPAAAALMHGAVGGPIRVLDIGVAETYDAAAVDAALRALLSAVAADGEATTRLVNEPAGSPVDEALGRLGWRETGRQFEMEMLL